MMEGFEQAQRDFENQEPPDNSCPHDGDDDCCDDCDNCEKANAEPEEDLGYDPDQAYEEQQDREMEGK